ncbi:fasciclin domain-containing protein [uncultured Draconibacterium sp.]|uniref:fasciclin domain-containing protein n=1 Tax=uncultured Draconibacterium sp. TaxID=1573823 RepID=UPI0032171286
MKTNFRSLGLALLLAIAVVGVNATELRNAEAEPGLELENWMTDISLFEVNKTESVAGTVVDIAVSNPDFSILVEAVTKADLAGALSADGPFTVFAPTNQAFENLFSQLGVEGINDLTAEQLTPILTYHVVSGKVMSTDLSNTSVATLNGQKIKVDLSDGVKINDSKVVAADISGNNGVIHVIDKVLVPEAKQKSGGCSN